jgi:hypothetical protein
MQHRENWFVIGLLFVLISMQMESWGKYVMATFAGIYLIASLASGSKDKPTDKFKRGF